MKRPLSSLIRPAPYSRPHRYVADAGGWIVADEKNCTAEAHAPAGHVWKSTGMKVISYTDESMGFVFSELAFKTRGGVIPKPQQEGSHA